MRSWRKEPIYCNDTRFDNVDILIDEYEVDPKKFMAAIALGHKVFRCDDGFEMELRFENEELEHDRRHKAIWLGIPGVKKPRR